MTRRSVTYLLPVAVGEHFPGSWLEDLRLETTRRGQDLVMDYREFHPNGAAELFEKDGKAHERLSGNWTARRLRFVGARDLVLEGLYENLAQLPEDHLARSLRQLLHWRAQGEKPVYYLFHGSAEKARLKLSAYTNRAEEAAPYASETVTIERDWSPAPPQGARRMAPPGSLAAHHKYGGDPIAFYNRGRRVNYRLFIGGLDSQPKTHPQVDSVLNLAIEPSVWYEEELHPADRWSPRGEDALGMDVEPILEEAGWVVERLQDGQRVLVHCYAGMNRSATVCCAALMLLEGLTPEQALARVRERHPWALPDSHHWLALRFFAQTRARSSDTTLLSGNQ